MVSSALERLIVTCIDDLGKHNTAGFAGQLRLVTMACFRLSAAITIPLSFYKTRKLDAVIRTISVLCDDVFNQQPWRNYKTILASILAMLAAYFFGFFILCSSFWLMDVIVYQHTWQTLTYSFFLLLTRIAAMHIRMMFYVLVTSVTTVIGLQYTVYCKKLKTLFRDKHSCEIKELKLRQILGDHRALSQAVETLNKILSPILLVTVALDLAVTIFICAHVFDGSTVADRLVYGKLTHSSALSTVVCALDLTWMMCVLFGPIVTCAYLNQQGERLVKPIMLFVGHENQECQFKHELTNKATAIKDFPPVLTLWNVIALDRNVFLVVLGVLGTYLFIILEISQRYENITGLAELVNDTSLKNQTHRYNNVILTRWL
ncbi:uncharacterized protein LOC129592197 [Paramacrobiotus metropolitanus]|uniref:uncharacterized protein LOC129592197 n=1 Tax=Paramacrobiotus metropolitanus TaxID=2943436 RepID=UPI002445975E|nr:uncharacterized protein LOC129592197 [Paramacrobiotus metropolitanus]